MIKLRKHQQEALEKCLEHFNSGKKEVVVGFVMGAGKTLLSGEIIKNLLKANPKFRVLILAHAQRILRKNFKDGIAIDSLELLGKDDFDKAKQEKVIVAIPQSLQHEDLISKIGDFDLIIVDEAHDFTGQKMVESILANYKDSKRLLLSANYWQIAKSSEDPLLLTYSMEEGIQDNYLSEVRSENVFVDIDCDISDFDNAFEAKKYLVDRIFHDTDDWIKFLNIVKENLVSSDNIIPKTLIFCPTQDVAKQLCTALKLDEDISKEAVVMSISDRKEDSCILTQFKNNPDLRIAVVVQRGILGFDLPALEQVIDLSMSYSYNRLFQVIGRLSRKSEEARFKKLIKIMPVILEDPANMCLAGTYALATSRYYNRPELIEKLPLKKIHREISEAGSRGRKKSSKFEFGNALNVFKVFTENLDIKDDAGTYSSFAELKNFLSLKYTFEECKQVASTFKYRAQWKKENPETYKTAKLNGWLDLILPKRNYRDISENTSDEELRKIIQESGLNKIRDLRQKFTAAHIELIKRDHLLKELCDSNILENDYEDFKRRSIHAARGYQRFQERDSVDFENMEDIVRYARILIAPNSREKLVTVFPKLCRDYLEKSNPEMAAFLMEALEKATEEKLEKTE